MNRSENELLLQYIGGAINKIRDELILTLGLIARRDAVDLRAQVREAMWPDGVFAYLDVLCQGFE